MIFFSQLIKLPVVDSHQEEIGRLEDIVVSVSKKTVYPEITGIIIKSHRKKAYIPYSFVENLGYGVVTLKKSNCWEFDYELGENEFLLEKDVLDQQIFDISGIRVVRVNDLELVKIDHKYHLIALDISNRGLLRRLGFSKWPFFGKIKAQMIDYENVSLVKGHVGSLQLKTTNAKLEKLHPADIANLIENLNVQESTKLMQSLDEETAAEVLEEVQPEYKDTLLEHINPKDLAEIVEEMETDEAANIMQDLSHRKREQVYKRLDEKVAQDIHRLSKYEVDVAGGLMSSTFFKVDNQVKVSDVLKRIRAESDEWASIYHIYVVDKNQKLAGVVSLRRLVLAKPTQKIASVMSSVVKTVEPDTEAEDVAQIMTKYNLLSVAVIDTKGFLKGVITVDDILRYLVPDA